MNDHGYTQEALADVAKIRDPVERLDVQAVARRVRSAGAFGTLVRLFILGESIATAAAARSLSRHTLKALLRAGLLQQRDARVGAQTMLLPVDKLFILRDFGAEVRGGPLRPDHVVGVSAASLTLARLTVRRQAKTVLDLGTGSGIQAFLAAEHAERVVATDTNRRALRLAALGARLNGLDNVEFRQGNLYQPVDDCRFDLIVSNPPFVISPQACYAYRDSGLPGDAVSQQVIRGAPRLLTEGGFCTVLFNWHHRADEHWAERPRRWVADSGCDAWIVRFDTEDPLTYAATWLRPTEGHDPDRYGTLLDEWLAYYRRAGIEAISAGAAVLRRRSGRANWLATETIPRGQTGHGGCGAQIERIFAGHDLLNGLDDPAALLNYPLVLCPKHRLEHQLQAENANWSVRSALLKQSEGFEFTGNVDRLMSTLLAGCDGRRLLRDRVAELAAGVGLQFGELAPACVGVLRRLLETGFLTVATEEQRDE